MGIVYYAMIMKLNREKETTEDMLFNHDILFQNCQNLQIKQIELANQLVAFSSALFFKNSLRREQWDVECK